MRIIHALVIPHDTKFFFFFFLLFCTIASDEILSVPIMTDNSLSIILCTLTNITKIIFVVRFGVFTEDEGYSVVIVVDLQMVLKNRFANNTNTQYSANKHYYINGSSFYVYS